MSFIENGKYLASILQESSFKLLSCKWSYSKLFRVAVQTVSTALSVNWQLERSNSTNLTSPLNMSKSSSPILLNAKSNLLTPWIKALFKSLISYLPRSLPLNSRRSSFVNFLFIAMPVNSLCKSYCFRNCLFWTFLRSWFSWTEYDKLRVLS